MALMKHVVRLAGVVLLGLGMVVSGPALAARIKVAGVYTQPIQEPWDGRLHEALKAAAAAGKIDYVYSESVANTDYVRVLREYADQGVNLIVGEAFGIGREARQVAKDYPKVAFLMGDTGKPAGNNYAVFDDYIQEPCYLMGMLAGGLTKTDKIGMVGGYPIGEVNRLFNAFMAGARAVNPKARFKVTFIGAWYDPPKAKESTLAQIESGVDMVFAERAGVVEAAREKHIVAFGNIVDGHQQENGKGVVATSALWNMGPAVNHAIDLVKAGTFKAADYRQWTMMAKGGASLAPYYDFKDRIPAALKARVEKTAAAIKAGTFHVKIDDSQPKSTY